MSSGKLAPLLQRPRWRTCAALRQRPTWPTFPGGQEHRCQRQHPNSVRHRYCRRWDEGVADPWPRVRAGGCHSSLSVLLSQNSVRSSSPFRVAAHPRSGARWSFPGITQRAWWLLPPKPRPAAGKPRPTVPETAVRPACPGCGSTTLVVNSSRTFSGKTPRI